MVKKTNWSAEKLGKAWLIQWVFHSADEAKQLKSTGIQRKIVDILSARWSLDKCREYVENLYKVQILTFSEKLPLEHYNFGGRNRKKTFGYTVPLFTNYQSKSYSNLTKYIANSGDLGSKEYKDLLNKWTRQPQFVSVGHNPSLEATMVFNLRVKQSKDGSEVLECDYPLGDGSKEHRSYVITN